MGHAILILGAAMRPDGTPGAALVRRARHGAALWRAAPGAMVLASGAQGEAQAIAAICRAEGVPEDRIVLEQSARNTAENIAFSAEILAGLGIVRVTLVSDYYHLPRARLLAARAGLRVVPAAPRHGIGRPHRHAWLVLREAAALVAALSARRRR
ncbi:YdcF family protein [Rhodovulum strictum]|uniref:YdcF family protein n=1 Tax=Rhodovulum strictum TaxID=58314 RepID=A0A844B2F1_9RHOB|nr:YdcF family protein [Rhodovulum strictum]MRH20546.1 YdcF family protein [Rhodovulum strictum]